MRALLLAWRPFWPCRIQAVGLRLLLHAQAVALLLQPARVVALPGQAVAALELQDPLGHVVEEVPVVGHQHDGAVVALQVGLQPVHRLGVQVVGGLVEQQQVGLLQQQAAQGHPALLAAGQVRHGGVPGGAAQGVHRHLEVAVEIPGVEGVDLILQLRLLLQQDVEVGVGIAHLVGDVVEVIQQLLDVRQAQADVADDIQVRIQLGLLGQVAHGVALRQPGLAHEVGIEARHDAQHGGLAGAVAADDADLGPRVEGQVDALQDLTATGVDLLEVPHVIDELLGHRRLRRWVSTGAGA